VNRRIWEQKNKKNLDFSGLEFGGKNDNLLDIETGSKLFLFNMPPVVYGAGQKALYGGLCYRALFIVLCGRLKKKYLCCRYAI